MMRRPMKRMAIFAALLIAVCAYGGNLTGNGDVSIKSYDKVIVIALDANGDGSPDRAFVIGMERALEKPIDLHWSHVSFELTEKSLTIVDSEHHRTFATGYISATPDGVMYTTVPYVIGIAHYPDLKPGFDLKSLTANW